MSFFYGLRNHHSLFGLKGVFLALKSRALGKGSRSGFARFEISAIPRTCLAPFSHEH
jgi:hypothetical protein